MPLSAKKKREQIKGPLSSTASHSQAEQGTETMHVEGSEGGMMGGGLDPKHASRTVCMRHAGGRRQDCGIMELWNCGIAVHLCEWKDMEGEPACQSVRVQEGKRQESRGARVPECQSARPQW